MKTPQHKNLFFVSGFISISSFIFLVFIIFVNFINHEKIKQYGMHYSETVNVSLSDLPVPKPDVVPEVSEISAVQSTQEMSSTSNSSKSEPQEKTDNIADLFSTVKPQKNTPSKTNNNREEMSKKIEALNALQKDVMSENKQSKLQEKVKNTQLSKPSIKMVQQGGSTGPEVNEYNAKIQGIIYNNFSPPAGSQGNFAKVKIKLSSDGRLLYYAVVSYSSNSGLNSEVDWLKDRLKRISFPKHPDNKDTVLEFILTAKE